MKAIINFFVICLVVFTTYSQETISGVVQDNTGVPLAGVTVLIENTAQGTATDFDGNFTIEAQIGDEIVFSYIGFKTAHITITNQKTINLTMVEDSEQLSEVVVTALGIKKEKKALGYASQEVAGNLLEKTKEPTVFGNLTGRVAGLEVNNSTDLFQDPKIVLRGRTNKTLIVIDGIPVDGSESGNTDYFKVLGDDVAQVNVLKGTTASALYGARGRNGAIMITTKKGKSGKINVALNVSTMYQPSFIRSPKVQTVYGNGNQGNYAYIDGSGSGTEGGGWIWGPRVDQKDPSTPSGLFETTQYNSPTDPVTGELIPIPFTSRGKDNIKNFFRTGYIRSVNASADWGSDKSTFRVSLSNVYQQGIVPNTDLNNVSFSLAGSMKPADNVNISGSMTYNKQFTENFPEIGYGPTNYLYNLVLWTGVDVDVRDLKNYWREGQEGFQQRHFNISYYNNPYFQAYEYQRGYDKDNIYGNLSLAYEVVPNLTLKARSGINVWSLYRTFKEPKSYIGYGSKSQGNFEQRDANLFDITSDLGLRYETKFSENFSLETEAAYAHYFKKQIYNSISTDGLTIPGFYNVSNNLGSTLFGENREEKSAIQSFYAYADLNFYNAFYLSLTGRNDKISALPNGNNSYFYPSISGSLIVSELFSKPSWLTFAKLRGGFSQVRDGNYNDNSNGPYSLLQAYGSGTIWNGVPSSSALNVLINPNVRTEIDNTWEIGADLRFFNNRLGIDLAYYNRLTEDTILKVPASDASGYTFRLENGGSTRTKGIEAIINATPLKTETFEWNTSLNLSHYRDYQVSIFGDAERTKNYVRVGERTDQIWDNVYQTNSEGEVVYENGFPVFDPFKRFIGHAAPDLIYGLNNTFKYKNFSLSLLFDGRLGGYMYSITNQKMWWGGKHPGTVNQFRTDANNGESTYVGNGVIVTDGTVTYDVNGNITSDTRTYAPNTEAINYITYNQTTSDRQNHNYHYYVRDYIKLREVTLTYNFGKATLDRLPFSDASLSFVGRNLWLSSTLENVDPEFNDNLQAPATRSLGLNLNLKF